MAEPAHEFTPSAVAKDGECYFELGPVTRCGRYRNHRVHSERTTVADIDTEAIRAHYEIDPDGDPEDNPVGIIDIAVLANALDAAVAKADTYQRMYYAEHGEIAAELDRLRADYAATVAENGSLRLAHVNCERDIAEFEETARAAEAAADRLAEQFHRERDDAQRAGVRARVAEAERDALASRAARIFEKSAEPDPVAEENADLRRRLAEVEALRDRLTEWDFLNNPVAHALRHVLRGEGDR